MREIERDCHTGEGDKNTGGSERGRGELFTEGAERRKENEHSPSP